MKDSTLLCAIDLFMLLNLFSSLINIRLQNQNIQTATVWYKQIEITIEVTIEITSLRNNRNHPLKTQDNSTENHLVGAHNIYSTKFRARTDSRVTSLILKQHRMTVVFSNHIFFQEISLALNTTD